MNLQAKSRWLITLAVVLLGGGVAGAVAYHRHALTELREEYETYQRQLRGELSEQEQELQRMHAELGVTRSKLMDRTALTRKYEAQLTEKDKQFEEFRKKHDLRVSSMQTSILALQQQVKEGRTTVVVHPPTETGTGTGGAGGQPGQSVISYRYDQGERIQLNDPNIFTEGDEQLTLNQRFRVDGVIFQQKQGSLMTSRVRLTEVEQQPDGSYRELAEAKLVEADFEYANPPPEQVRKRKVGWDLSLMATVGTAFRSEGPLVFGASMNVVRFRSVGLAAGLASDFNSLEGSGPELFLTWRPALGGKDTNFMMGAGGLAPLGGSTRVIPTVNASFVLY